MNLTPQRSLAQDSIIFGLFALGLFLMVGVIHYANFIDNFWSPEYFATPLSPSIEKPSSQAPLLVYDEVEIQAILDHAENLRSANPAPTPAQAIIEGRGTKFLMGL